MSQQQLDRASDLLASIQNNADRSLVDDDLLNAVWNLLDHVKETATGDDLRRHSVAQWLYFKERGDWGYDPGRKKRSERWYAQARHLDRVST